MKLNSSWFATVWFATLVGILSVATARSDDWPQWRGPQRNGISKETGLLKEWPKDGPPLLWSSTDLGNGYSSLAVVGDRIFTLANEGADNESVQAHDAKAGKRLWQTRLGKVGPNPQQANYAAARSTPTIDGNFLYALGSDGDLASLSLDGKIRWQKNLRSDFAGKSGDWSYAESPLIDGDTLVCTPGGAEATLIALNKNTGAPIWKCALPEADAAAFSSIIIVNTGGTKQYVQLLSKGLVGIDAKSGKLLWRYSKPISVYGANIPTPLAADDYIYVASAGTGGGAVHLIQKDGQFSAEEAYFSPKNPTAIGGVIKVGPNLFGTTGGAMECLEFTTGKILWEDRAAGPASMVYADNRLYLHAENGEVALVEPSAEAYHQKGRFTPPNQPKHTHGQMEKSWAYPVVANGHLYIRDHNVLWCYDVKAK
jgi:outer membrane protein assembly factor BamB